MAMPELLNRPLRRHLGLTVVLVVLLAGCVPGLGSRGGQTPESPSGEVAFVLPIPAQTYSAP